MGKQVTTVSGVAGLGTLFAGVGAAKVIDGLPPWVSVALFAVGAALVLAAFISHLLSGKADEGVGPTASTDGASSLAMAAGRDIHYHPPAPVLQPERSPYGSYDVGKLTDGLERVARGLGGGAVPRLRAQGIADRMVAEEARRCPEMPIGKAVEYVAGTMGDTYEKDDFAETRRQLRQAAGEGRIDVWGQKDIPPAHLQDERHSTIWTPIEPTYWHDYELTPISTVDRFDDRAHTCLEELPSKHGNRYWSLRVRERQIKGRWDDPKSVGPKSLQPDFPLNGLVIRVYGHYGYPRDNPSEEQQRRQINLLIMDKVIQHGLSVWARRNDLPLEKIGLATQKKAKLDHRKGQLRALSIDGPMMVFNDIHFNRAEVDAVWPDPLRTSNDGKP